MITVKNVSDQKMTKLSAFGKGTMVRIYAVKLGLTVTLSQPTQNLTQEFKITSDSVYLLI